MDAQPTTSSQPRRRGMPKGRTGNPNGRPLALKKKIVINARIDEDLHEWLQLYAANTGQRMSSVIQTALSLFRTNKEA